MTNLKAQYWNNDKTPYYLIELSTKQFRRMKDNMVIVSEPVFKFNKVESKSPSMVYKKYSVGKNITFIEDKN